MNVCVAQSGSRRKQVARLIDPERPRQPFDLVDADGRRLGNAFDHRYLNARFA